MGFTEAEVTAIIIHRILNQEQQALAVHNKQITMHIKFPIKVSLLIAGVLLLSMLETYAQGTYIPPILHHKSSSLRRFLNAKLLEQKDIIPLDSCMQGISFAKFSIDTKGKISDLSFSHNSPAIIDSVLFQIIKSTEGLWTPAMIGKRAIKSKPFILPLIFLFEAPCGTIKEQISGVEILGKIEDMLYFDGDIKQQELDCILLEPLSTSSVR